MLIWSSGRWHQSAKLKLNTAGSNPAISSNMFMVRGQGENEIVCITI